MATRRNFSSVLHIFVLFLYMHMHDECTSPSNCFAVWGPGNETRSYRPNCSWCSVVAPLPRDGVP